MKMLLKTTNELVSTVAERFHKQYFKFNKWLAPNSEIIYHNLLKCECSPRLKT